MVVRRAGAVGDYGIQLFDVVRVYRGRHRARRARGAVRATRHGLRPRVHPRTGGGRVTGRNRAARAVLGRGGVEGGGRRVRLVRGPRVPTDRAPSAVRVAAPRTPW